MGAPKDYNAVVTGAFLLLAAAAPLDGNYPHSANPLGCGDVLLLLAAITVDESAGVLRAGKLTRVRS